MQAALITEEKFLQEFGADRRAKALEDINFMTNQLHVADISWNMIWDAWAFFEYANAGKDIQWHIEFKYRNNMVINLCPQYLFWRFPNASRDPIDVDGRQKLVNHNFFYERAGNTHFGTVVWFKSVSYTYFRRCLLLLRRKMETVGGQYAFKDVQLGMSFVINEKFGKSFIETFGYFRYALAEKMNVPRVIWSAMYTTWDIMRDLDASSAASAAAGEAVGEAPGVTLAYTNRYFETISLSPLGITFTPADGPTGAIIRRIVLNNVYFVLGAGQGPAPVAPVAPQMLRQSNSLITFDPPLSRENFRLCLYEFVLQKPVQWQIESDTEPRSSVSAADALGTLGVLPAEIVRRIALVDVKTLLNLSMTSTPFANLDTDPKTWRYLVQRDFPATFVYFGEQLPALMCHTRYMRADIDYDTDSVGAGIPDNPWKRYYLWLRRFYRQTELFTTEELDDPSGLLEQRCNSLLFSEPSVARFCEMVITEITFGFHALRKADDRDTVYDTLAIHMMDGEQDLIKFKLQMVKNPNTGVRESQNIRVRSAPLEYFLKHAEQYVNNENYNKFYHHLLRAIYNGRKYALRDFRFCEYEKDWAFPPEVDQGFFRRVSQIFDGRLHPLLTTASEFHVSLVLYSNQDAIRETLELLLPILKEEANEELSWRECALEVMPARQTLIREAFQYCVFRSMIQNPDNPMFTRETLSYVWHLFLKRLSLLPRYDDDEQDYKPENEDLLLLHKVH